MTQQETGVILCHWSPFPDAEVATGECSVSPFVNGGMEQALLIDSLISLSHPAETQTEDVISLSALISVRLLPPKCSVIVLCPHDVCIGVLCAGPYGAVQSATLMGPKTNSARRKRKETTKPTTYWSSWMCNWVSGESWHKGREGHAVDNMPSLLWQQCGLSECTTKTALLKGYILSSMSAKASLKTELWQFIGFCKPHFKGLSALMPIFANETINAGGTKP